MDLIPVTCTLKEGKDYKLYVCNVCMYFTMITKLEKKKSNKIVTRCTERYHYQTHGVNDHLQPHNPQDDKHHIELHKIADIGF